MLENIHVTYIGNAIPMNDCYTHLGPNVSGNRLNLGIIGELDSRFDSDFITLYPIASYPKEKKIYIKREKINLYKNIFSVKVFYINILIFKQLISMLSAFFEAIKYQKKNKKNIIICYNAQFITAMPTLLTAKFKRCKTICLLADIPIDVPEHFNIFKKVLSKLDIYLYHKTINKFDGLIVLNKYVIDIFAPGKKYIVMDGGISDDEITYALDSNDQPIRNDNVILYTGALEKYNGIMELIAGFNLLKDKKILLHICGDGSLRQFIQESSNENKNIKYFGTLQNDIIQKMQRNASLLISTRPVDTFTSQVTFPSKIIEYMLSGTPVLTTKLNGFTEEYFPNLYFTGQTPEDIASSIEEIFNISIEERNKKGQAAKMFVINNKNYKNHGIKIASFIEDL